MPKKIILSAGHGAGAPGVTAFGRVEATEALWLRDAVAEKLRTMGVEVLEDGADGVNESLPDVLKLMRRNKGVEAWELHFNAPGEKSRGVEVLSPLALQSRAQAVARVISTINQSPLRGARGWKAPHEGAHHRLAFCDEGGGVIEVEFLTNPHAMAVYMTNRSALVDALAAVLAA
jgi:N-acetylmuramoyl-L-alanine amidase